jgi:hypothetical protein
MQIFKFVATIPYKGEEPAIYPVIVFATSEDEAYANAASFLRHHANGKVGACIEFIEAVPLGCTAIALDPPLWTKETEFDTFVY